MRLKLYPKKKKNLGKLLFIVFVILVIFKTLQVTSLAKVKEVFILV